MKNPSAYDRDSVPFRLAYTTLMTVLYGVFDRIIDLVRSTPLSVDGLLTELSILFVVLYSIDSWCIRRRPRLPRQTRTSGRGAGSAA